MPHRSAVRVLPLAVVVLLAGCGSGGAPGVEGSGATAGTTATETADGTAGTGTADGSADPARPAPRTPASTTARPAPPPASWTATCPTSTPSPVYGCRAVRGTVIAIESVDPDGDGDLHVIVREQLPAGGVTLPGISVLDVRPALRPARDPRRGETVTGAGPVFRGSFRQKQVQVDTFRIWRP